MLKGAVGRRYARAIFDIAVERGDLDAWLHDLRQIRAVLGEPRIAAVMENPSVPFETKKQIADSVLSDVDGLRRNLVYLLIRKRRTEIIEKVRAEFEELMNAYRGVAFADVTTAVPLSGVDAAAVSERLSQLTGKRVEVRVAVDPSIIGGLVARIGDRLLDGSVKGRLVALRQRLAGAAV